MTNGPVNGQAVEIVTHDGGFHPDDVFATAILSTVFPGAEIIRTRSVEFTSPAPGRVVYDVGGAYDPSEGMFDHHQAGSPLREDGTPYSSFGLVWKEYGKRWLSLQGMEGDVAARVFDEMDAGIVRSTDHMDNGVISPKDAGPVAGATIFDAILDHEPSWSDDDPEIAMNEAFDAAVSVASSFLERRAASLNNRIEAEIVFMRAVEESCGSGIVVLPGPMPWHDAACMPGAEHVLIVIHPRPNGQWVVAAAPEEPGSFRTRISMPEEWAGLSGGDLVAESGVGGAIFCHKGRFMAVADGAEGALTMAEMAIEASRRNDPSP